MTLDVEIALVPALIPPESLDGRTAIIIDLFRATTVIVAALAHGAKSVTPVRSVAEALDAKKQNDSLIIGGERGGRKIDGFDRGNSPLEYLKDNDGRDIVLTTSNGTAAILHAHRALSVLIGCLNNANAVVETAAIAYKPITIICAGEGGNVSLEDSMCAGYLAQKLFQYGYDLARDDGTGTAFFTYKYSSLNNGLESIRETKNARTLRQIGFPQDVAYCLKIDNELCVPRFNPKTNAITLQS